MSETMQISEDQNAKLEWAFSTIHEFMLSSGTLVLQSKLVPLVVSYLGEST